MKNTWFSVVGVLLFGSNAFVPDRERVPQFSRAAKLVYSELVTRLEDPETAAAALITRAQGKSVQDSIDRVITQSFGVRLDVDEVWTEPSSDLKGALARTLKHIAGSSGFTHKQARVLTDTLSALLSSLEHLQVYEGGFEMPYGLSWYVALIEPTTGQILFITSNIED